MSATSTQLPIAGAATEPLTECGLCGHFYAQSAQTGCSSCPMNDGCLMTCCPNCGYSAPDPRNSKLLGAAHRIIRAGRSRLDRRRRAEGGRQ